MSLNKLTILSIFCLLYSFPVLAGSGLGRGPDGSWLISRMAQYKCKVNQTISQCEKRAKDAAFSNAMEYADGWGFVNARYTHKERITKMTIVDGVIVIRAVCDLYIYEPAFIKFLKENNML